MRVPEPAVCHTQISAERHHISAERHQLNTWQLTWVKCAGSEAGGSLPELEGTTQCSSDSEGVLDFGSLGIKQGSGSAAAGQATRSLRLCFFLEDACR